MTLIVDASVAVKWYLEEENSDRAAAILDGSESIVAPDLIIAEVCNVTWKAVRLGRMTAVQQDAAASGIVAALNLLVPTSLLASRAIAISRLLDHPAYDCFYLALCERQDAPMVTFDARLLRRVAGTEWERYVEAC